MGKVELLILGLMFAATTCCAHAAQAWETPLNVTSGTARVKLGFGQKDNATPGVDGRYEVPSLPGRDLQAFFLIDNGTYWRDIRPANADGSTTWDLTVLAPAATGRITLSWDADSLPAETSVQLVDVESNRTTNMKSQDRYSFDYAPSRKFQIRTRHQGDK